MIYKGKTIEEAIGLAEKNLGISRDKFSFSVTEKKIGLFKKEVEISVESICELSKGEIRNKKFVFYKGEGKVLLVPTEEVSVFVNGQIINENTYVGEDDEVEFKEKKKESKKGFVIDIDENGLVANLKITSTPEVVCDVSEHEMSNTIIIRGQVISTGELDKISLDEIKKELLNKGIKYGVDFKAIDKAIEAGSGVIAKGKETVKSIDDKIIYFFQAYEKRSPIEVNGKVDYYSIEEIECVEKGNVLAEIEEGIEGQNGVDVFGKILEVSRKKTASLKVGPGAILSDDKKKVLSLISGKPSLNGEKVCVVPIFQIDGDADLKVGNLEFAGDIVISGSVKEGMKISSGGNIQIGGSVLEASIHSKGDIKIRENLIASQLKAGNVELNEKKYVENLNNIKNFLKEIAEVVEEIRMIMPKKYQVLSQAQILKKIIDSKYITKKAYFKSLKEEYVKLKMSNEITILFDKFFRIYDLVMDEKNVEIKTISDFNLELIEFLDNYVVATTSGNIYLSYSQNSKIYSSADVYINGKGCYCTDIEAEGKIVISGYPGTFRSGAVYGKKGVCIKEVGSSAGIKSIIKTGIYGEIEAELIYHNTLLVVGNFNYYVDEPIRKVKVYIKNGELAVEKFKV
ncbi:DUF342 domain-containing protein [Clostridium cylindrosporum]|uniref:RNA-binding protein KhpB N-terminal domain-containing protein n=1 Tax=Clostridium cylindrosporum DSM 605 TaxID=1121307 RepID=A0A0J8DBI3_CLOCY|nr:FapA family protein [Clostridium cylindrosporum]KMT21674.1 hypothetical protein CLCY_2c04360 [Clostridium cylindrosporum DSM 605]